MRSHTIIAAVVVVLLASVLVGPGIRTDAHASDSAMADSPFVGTWRVMVSFPDGGGFPVLSTYMSDGTAIHNGPIAQPSAPGAPYTVLFTTTGQGVWEATGAEGSDITFDVMMSDERGTFLGRQTISGEQSMEPDGDTFTGRFVITVTDPTGNVVATVSTTATAERMRLERPALGGTPEST